MKIGIVGGTFNPIHLGHLMLGEYAHEACGLDEIWFMPNGNPPHKKIFESEITTDVRINMTQLAIEGVPYFTLNTYEMDKRDVSYSYKTMEEFVRRYPEYEFYFIIGSDSLFTLDKWKCPEQLLQHCTILAACREHMDMDHMEQQIEYLKNKYSCEILLLEMPVLDISSSDIRSRVKHGKSIKYIVPDAVRNYIEDKNLYED